MPTDVVHDGTTHICKASWWDGQDRSLCGETFPRETSGKSFPGRRDLPGMQGRGEGREKALRTATDDRR
ncbi:hypothetical protein FHX42_001679 [Saccharopolyspora lacisalsi]|uniref:Uncharacterized protein n=1 Tax=Halosaccharopolyspora lacisalsi TaxID=1000566 RepID=A0A839DQS5_9PSEU|nr:hypothetical protein [Halosaccharopolyspora lacisalsi]